MAAEERRSALITAIVAGTALQVAMVAAGHFSPAVAAYFAVGGMGISLLAGLLYALRAGPLSPLPAGAGGAVAGGVCALLGIVVSFLLGDVSAVILIFGTASSAVTGAIGGTLGRLFVRMPAGASAGGS